MDKPQDPAAIDENLDPRVDGDVPPGNHALEVAARRGIGPLSPLGRDAWHGQAKPCVSCGQLVRRGATACDACGQDLSEAMLAKMRAHAGPWYVLEHVRPFPGVSLERIIRQIRRGLITETSIVRGPSTDFQWRFAVEAPGLCRYFGRCWRCHEAVSPSDTYCQHCLSYLSLDKPPAHPAVTPTPAGPTPEPGAQAVPSGTGSGVWSKANGPGVGKAPAPSPPHPKATSTPTEELRRLSAAVGKAELPSHEPVWDEPPRIAGIRATWVAVALLAIVIAALIFITESRTLNPTTARPTTPGMVLPR